MEVLTPTVYSDGNRSCQAPSDAGTLLHQCMINTQAACRAPVDDAYPRKVLQAASTQSRKINKSLSNGACPVHVVVVINDTNNPPHPPNADPLKNSKHAECRICQEEDDLHQLDIPCACTGTLMYAHRKCVQRWCDEKGGTTCEICQQPYKSGYTASSRSHHNIRTFMDSSDQVELLHADEEVEESSDMVVVAAAQRRFLDAEYEESNSSSAACCRSAALLFMVLLLLRHAIAVAATSSTLQEDTSTLLSLFSLRVASFLLPCYIVVRAINMAQKRYRREEANMHNMDASSTEISIVLQAGRL